MSPETTIAMALTTPLAGVVLILLARRNPNLRETMTMLSAVALFGLVVSLLSDVYGGGRPTLVVAEMLPGLEIKFVVEPLGIVFALVASFLWIVTSIYSIGYMRGHHEKNQTRFYVFFAIALFAVTGIAFAGNMLSLFVFYEILTLGTFPLVTHSGTDEAKRAGRVYMGILIGTSVGFLLLAIIWTWTITGTLDFADGGILEGNVSHATAAALLVLYVFGIGKAALMPFHRWLPAAMVAPTPVSALLHAVAVVKAGVFTVLKVTIYIFGVDFLKGIDASEWLQYAAATTIIVASMVAMKQDNLKARLAYSTISQLSYIVLGAMLVSDNGVIGGGMHIATHAFGKITLFFCAGAFIVASHKTKVSEMRGIGRVMPFTTIAFLIGSLSIIGLPPFGGLWSKWYIAMGALDADKIWPVAVLMFSSLLNIAYLLPVPFNGFFSKPDPGEFDNAGKIREAPVFCLIAIAVSSLGTVALFLYPDPLFNMLSHINLR